jgi:hypothetical protein
LWIAYSKAQKPGDWPIEFAASFWLAANVRAAQSLGISLPTRLLARADEMIEQAFLLRRESPDMTHFATWNP